MIGNLRSFCYTGIQDGHNKTVTAAEGPVKKESNIMYRENFKTQLPHFSDRQVLISELGAVSGTFSDEAGRQNAKVINRAIRELSEHGGGTLVIPAGIWASAPIRLLSHVRLHLESQALLKFTKNREDYPLVITNYEGQECIRAISPIMAEGAENIAITGDGIIDGSGDLWRPVKRFKVTDIQWEALLKKSSFILCTRETEIWMPTETILTGNEKNIQGTDENALKAAADYYDFYRPVLLSLKHCKKILLQGVTFMNSPAWNLHPFFCEDLTVDHVKVRNPYYAQNGDGIDVESCTNVHIHHCTFETGDDGICVKAGKNAVARTFYGPCSNIHIHDCVVYEGHGGFVIGSEMSRDVRDILVERCTFLGTDVGIRLKSALGRGGRIENITIRDIDMMQIKQEAVILTMSYQLNLLDKNEEIIQEAEEDVPHFDGIHMERIRCYGCETAVKIDPLAGRNDTITNVTLRDSMIVQNDAVVIERIG